MTLEAGFVPEPSVVASREEMAVSKGLQPMLGAWFLLISELVPLSKALPASEPVVVVLQKRKVVPLVKGVVSVPGPPSIWEVPTALEVLLQVKVEILREPPALTLLLARPSVGPSFQRNLI